MRHVLAGVITAQLLLVLLSGVVQAQVRSSSNYQLQRDSINVGGGLSTSTSYQQQSTVGEVATGRPSSANYTVRAGYQQLAPITISLSGASSVTMGPALPGITGGTSTGSTTVTVTTNNNAGYQLTIAADNNPAMQRSGGSTIADYAAGGTPDFAFTVPPAAAVFGYSPEGADISAAFQDNGSACGVGSLDTAGACWRGLATISREIARRTTAAPAGVDTTIQFQVGISSGAGVESGVYTATTTLTALPL